MRFVQSIIDAILDLLGLGKPLTPEQEIAKKVRLIHELNVKFKNSMWRAEDDYARLVIQFGIDPKLAYTMAESVFEQTDLVQDMDRQVTDAVERLKCKT